MENIEERLVKIENRNSRVEADKAWETSWTRRVSVAALTYLVVGAYMSAIGVGRPWLNAIVPTAGFLLSTLTLSFIRKIWISKFKK